MDTDSNQTCAAPLAGQGFARRLVAWRSERGLSMNEIKDQLGVAWATARAWLEGQSLPKARDLPFLASQLEWPLEELVALVAADRAERAAGNLEANVRRHQRADAAMAAQLVEEQAKAAAEDQVGAEVMGADGAQGGVP